MGVRAISVRGVFNKKFQICSNILRSYMICCVYVCMYGYEMVCISMHEYLLAPSKVWTVPQPISQPFEELPGWNSELKLFTTTYIISVLCKFVAPYWGVTWSVVCYYRYVWVWKGGYKYAWVFISPQQGLNTSPAPHMFISQPFEELPGWNLELKIFTSTYIISVLLDAAT